MLSIAGGIIFLIGAVAMVVACWRVERVHKAVIGKFSQDTQDLSAPLSDYVDRGVLLDNLQVNFDMTRTIETTVNKYQVRQIHIRLYIVGDRQIALLCVGYSVGIPMQQAEIKGSE